jgi:hypothetical protein
VTPQIYQKYSAKIHLTDGEQQKETIWIVLRPKTDTARGFLDFCPEISQQLAKFSKYLLTGHI